MSDRTPPPAAVTQEDRDRAASILRDLLHRIAVGNANADAHPGAGRCSFLVSHAWTDGPSIRLVYVAPPSDRIWGLARDTRRSLIGLGPWGETDDPALYYYLLDLEENWPGAQSREPAEAEDAIGWRGHVVDGLPAHARELIEEWRYAAPPTDPSWIDRRPPPAVAPRRYADPNGPLSPGVVRPTR